MESLRSGDLMFGPIGGFVPGVLPVGAGQVLLADRKARLSWRQWWHLRHVGVVVSASEHHDGPTARFPDGHYEAVDPDALVPLWSNGAIPTFYPTGVITAPRLVQAMPPGAEEIDMSQQKHWTADHVFVRPAYKTVDQMLQMSMPVPSNLYARAPQGEAVAAEARRYIGTPYGFLTYAALAADFLIPDGPAGMRLEGRIARRITDRREMICSQLADQALADAGFHVFTDGRLPQDVVPAELFRALMAMPGTLHIHPGGDVWSLGSKCAHL